MWVALTVASEVANPDELIGQIAVESEGTRERPHMCGHRHRKDMEVCGGWRRSAR